MPLSAHEFERRLIFYASPTLTKLKVACICAKEKVNPKMIDTVEAKKLE